MNIPTGVSRKLGYYVYLYVDPATESIFYVGKGKGGRAIAHLEQAANAVLAQRVQAIRSRGDEPRVEVLIHGISDEEVALRVEAAVIDLLGVHTLCNEIRGWGSGEFGRAELGELVSMYMATPVEIDIPVILIRINQLFRYGMTPVELYDATRGVWKVGDNRHGAKYAFGVFDGIVREVYEIERWLPAGSTFSTRAPGGVHRDGRFEFVGRVAAEPLRSTYRLKSVREYFPAKSRNPIRYVNVS